MMRCDNLLDKEYKSSDTDTIVTVTYTFIICIPKKGKDHPTDSYKLMKISFDVQFIFVTESEN